MFNHLKTARSYLFKCHPTRLSKTLDTRPLRLRSYPLRGVHTYSLQAGPGQATGRPRTVGLASGNADQRQPYPKRGGQGTDDDDDDDEDDDHFKTVRSYLVPHVYPKPSTPALFVFDRTP